jgi:hypothetical protein
MSIDEIEVELANDQGGPADVVEPTGSEVQNETPADKGEKQEEPSTQSEESDSFVDDKVADEKIESKDNEPEKPEFDEDLDTWAERAGHDKPETDRERKLLQNLRNSQREFTKDRQAKKSVDVVDDVIKSEQDSVVTEEDEIYDPIEKTVSSC